MIDFSGSVVVVTGASSGLGRAMAESSASLGAKAVVLNYAKRAEGARLAAQNIEANGCEALLVQGDVADKVTADRLAAATEAYGRVDVIFNNAGVTVWPQPDDPLGLTADDFVRLYQVNVIGAFLTVRALLPLLQAAPAPAVVNTASTAALNGRGSSIPYSASKAALVNMTMSLARALAPKVRVNAVCPGFMDTPWFHDLGQASQRSALLQAVRQTNPLDLITTAVDVAATALFLASPAAKHITGEAFRVDAGAHLL